ncbi:transmembrane amino acid transporter protein-domain-containing protein [Kockovaella imperatae]|uniref:Transmembrane amino acid transporter protein-domain-containing protein n=1 Tax=Kockovaella imperatae TaxID=4999 RepID=A0A1Y1UQ05_9TREE|nr:transmembrane amino acid transporter protein-domain-containing protein [Kockovaella imperatae]ORX40103.1 transmembrane amino acid transporter protein-domain-containing protein [Kockovaella imperatae]
MSSSDSGLGNAIRMSTTSTSSAGPSSSRASSRPSSRLNHRSPDPPARKLRIDSNEEIRLSQEDSVLFKGPEDDDAEPDEIATSHDAPLLAGRQRDVSRDELDELTLAEGPSSAGRGTLLDGIANMANSIIGAGIVGLPYAIAQAGFVMGIFLLVALGAVTDWTIRLVVVNAKLSGRNSYTEVMHHCFGRTGSNAVSFFQFAFAFGGMCAFNVIIGDTIPHVIAMVIPSSSQHAILRLLVDRRMVIFLVTILVSFPLSLHRDIVKLSKSSSFAVVSMGVIVASVIIRGLTISPELRGAPLSGLSLVRPGVFEAIGVISFAFVCHHNTMFIYQSIDTPTLDRFTKVVHVSTGFSVFCCLLMAVVGYLVFTDKTQGNILNNFSPDDFVINIARFCFGANMSTTLPLENYVCREVIEEYFFGGRPFSYTRHVVFTSLIVFSAMTVSLLTCDLGVVLEIAGGLSATALAFIFPASAYITLVGGKWFSRQKLPACLTASFGVVVLVLNLAITIGHAFSDERRGKQCD